MLNPNRIKPEQMAKWFHEIYLQEAKKYGWNVQPDTDVPYDDLPDANKVVMIATADKILWILKGKPKVDIL